MNVHASSFRKTLVTGVNILLLLTLALVTSALLPQPAHSQSEIIPFWKTEYDSAQFFWTTDMGKSVKLLLKAERIAFNDLGIYDESYLAIVNDLGLAYGQINNYTKAEEYLRKSLAIQQEIYAIEDPRVWRAACNLAAIVLKSGDDHRAELMYRDVLDRSQYSLGGATYMIAAENLTRLYEAHDQLDSALLTVRNALSTQFSNPVIRDTYKLQLAEGRILRKEKLYPEARQILSTLNSSASSTTLDFSFIISSIKLELSLIDIELGLYGKAEIEMLQLYRTLKSRPATDDMLLTELTNGLAYVYEKLGVYDKALVYYQESFSRCVVACGYNSLNCSIMRNNMAGVYLKQGLIAEAIVEYQRFIKTFESASNDNTTFLTATSNLAAAYRQNGQYDLALNTFNIVFQKLEEKGLLQTDLAAIVMNNMAVTFTLKGDYAKASDYFEKVLNIKEKLYGADSPVLLDVISNLAISYWALQNSKAALPLFQRSLALTRKEVNYIFPNLTETEQVQFYQQHKLNFERFNTLTVQEAQRNPELLVNMFNNGLFLKSLTFFTHKKRNSLVTDKADPGLKALVELGQTKGIQLGHFYQMTLHELQSLGISLPVLEEEIDSLEKVIRHSIGKDAIVRAHVEWKDIREALKENEVVIDLIRFRKYDKLETRATLTGQQISIGFTDSVYYAALITSRETENHPELVLLKNGNSLEKRYLSYFRNALKFDIPDTISYAQFWKPFESYVSGKTKVCLSADGVFNQINLNALQDKEGKFIIEKYDLLTILNAAQLVGREETKAIDFTKVVLVGDPVFNDPTTSSSLIEQTPFFESLPGTRDEINGIMSALKLTAKHTDVFMRTAANEVNLSKVNSPSILHIATHGFFSSNVVYINEQAKNNFLFHSGLVLSAQSVKKEESPFDHDGIVTAYDVLNLELTNTSLVVLSACDTGLGKVENGEGVYGLQRSFLQAGAKDIVISLWKVEDTRTKELMIKFYSYMSQQHTAREAFKLAQLDMLHQVGNPRLWAAFVMVSGG